MDIGKEIRVIEVTPEPVEAPAEVPQPATAVPAEPASDTAVAQGVRPRK